MSARPRSIGSAGLQAFGLGLGLCAGLAPCTARAARPDAPLFSARPEGSFIEIEGHRSTESRTTDGLTGEPTFEERMLTERLRLGVGGHLYHKRLAQYHLAGELAVAEEFMQGSYAMLPGGEGTLDLFPEHLVGLTAFGSAMQIQVDRTFARSYEVTAIGYGGVLHTRARVFPVDVSYTHRESEASNFAAPGFSEADGPPEADSKSDEYAVSGRYGVAGGSTTGQVQASRHDEVVHGQEIHRLQALASHQTTFQNSPRRGLTAFAQALNQQDVAETTTLGATTALDWAWLPELSSRHQVGYDRTMAHAAGGADTAGGTSGDARTVDQTVDGVDASSSLRHQLYQSLTSTLDVDGHYESADYGTQTRYGGGLGEAYEKRLGGWGRLSLDAAPRVDRTSRTTTQDTALVVDEAHSLAGPAPERLNNPDAELASVRVTDQRGIPFREGVDYTATVRGRFVELERVATGDIPAGATVLVDYRYLLPGAADVLVKTLRLGAAIAVLDAVTPYVRYTVAEPERLGGRSDVDLERVDDLVAGVRLGGLFFAAEAQYERSRATYNSFRANSQSLTLFWPRTSRVTVSLTGTHAVFNYEDPGAGLRRLSSGFILVVPLATQLSLNSDLSWQRERWNREGTAASNALDAYGGRAAINWQFRALDVELGARYTRIDRSGTVENQDLIYFRARRAF